MAVANAIAPEHLELHRAPTPRRSCRWCATPARCSAGPGRRRRSATTSPGPATCCPPYGSARFGQALTVADFTEARPRRHARPRRRSSGSRPHVAALAEAEGLAAHADSVRAARPRRRVTVPRRASAPRDDVAAAWRATTRRRSTSTVRLNTNESPDAAARRRCVDALAAELRRVDWHRYPDRAATELRAAHRRAPRRRPRAGLRGQRLQRGAADPAASPTAGRAARSPCSSRPTRCTPTSPASPAPRWSRASAPPTSRSTSTRCGRVLARRRARPSRSCARPTTPPAWSRPRRRCATVLDLGARAARGRRGLRPVRAVVGARRWSTTTRPLVVTRTFSKTWSMAAARLGYLVGPVVARGRARQGRAAVPPRRGQAGRRRARARLRRRDGARGSPALVEERGRLVAALRDLPRRRVAVGRQLRAVPARRRATATTCGRRCSTARSSSATARRGPASTAACGSPSAPPTRTTLPRRPRGGPGMTPRRDSPAAARPPRRRRSPSTLDLDGTGARRGVAPGLPFFDHMLDQLGRHGGFDLTVAGHRRPRGRRPPHRRGRRHHARRGVRARRSATRPASAASPVGLFPLDEALVEVALDLSGRPFVVYDVPFGEVLPLGDPPFDPELAEHFWQSFATAAGITLHVTQAGRAATPTTSSRPRSRASPAACATPCGSRATACRPPRASL